MKIEQVLGLLEIGLSLNELYVLEALNRGEEMRWENAKIASWISTLRRKLLIDSELKVTEKGKLLIEEIRSGKRVGKSTLRKAKLKVNSDFDKWWEAFPSTDVFEINNKKFNGSRSFKTKKEECQAKFTEIVNSGKYTAEELIEAIKLEVEHKKKASFKSKENKLKYLHNTATYLKQGDYIGWVEQLRKIKEKNKKETTIGTFDI